MLKVRTKSRIRKGPDEVMLARALFRVAAKFKREQVASAFVKLGYAHPADMAGALKCSDSVVSDALDFLQEETRQSKTTNSKHDGTRLDRKLSAAGVKLQGPLGSLLWPSTGTASLYRLSALRL